MITEYGIVTRATPAMAWIKTNRTATCGGCTAKDSCGTMHRGQEMMVEVPNTIGVTPGDSVVIGIETKPVMLLTFLVYVVPIICLVIGALAGDAVSPLIGINPSFSAMVLGFSAFGAAFFVLHKKSAALDQKKGYKPVLIRKTKPVASVSCPSSSK
ncbi:MAG: SoxR reducing system RseC family protein [Desulfobacteraceae bacterium]|nr:SoxR reducing system RseC family protein [Desulfobacteraceae bacterium]